MISALLTLSLLAALLCLTRNLRRGAFLCIGTALFLLFGVGTGLLLPVLLVPLQGPYPQIRQPQWGKRNAIVLLGAGVAAGLGGEVHPSIWSYSRMAEAVRLYRACRQEGHDCALFVSGGDADLTGRSEAEVYRDTLLGLGVDPRDLRLETHSLNTFQNAQFSSELLKREGADQVVLVSSGIHLRRSLCYFTHFGIRAEASASDRMKEKRSWMPLAYNLNLADVACHEHLGIFRYRVYQALGWNPKSTSPGGL